MNVVQELGELLKVRVVRSFALIGLFSLLGKTCFELKYFVRDLDMWWHLKIGDWIVAHSAVPHNGIFSYVGASRPWIAYSWAYEVLLSRVYAWFGVIGLASFGVVTTMGVAFAIYFMMRQLSGNFWLTWLLAFPACYSFLFILAPRPVNISMILFVVVLTLLLRAQSTGRKELLYWLPPIFLVWANFHIQFIYGLFVVGLFVAVTAIQHLARPIGAKFRLLTEPTLPFNVLLGVFLTCLAATLIGPNSYHIYQVVFSYSRARITYSTIEELQPLTHNRFDCLLQLLLLAGAAFYSLGRQKQTDLFKLSLLTVASTIAIRTARDAWFIAIPAAACLADALRREETKRERSPSIAERFGVSLAILFLWFLLARNYDFNQKGLDGEIRYWFPVDAVNFLRLNPAPGPLYNNLDWGGFLIWYCPQYEVAIDGRNDLYGEEIDARFSDTADAKNYAGDPYLSAANLLLLDKTLPLVPYLAVDPKFRVLYQDSIAIVLVRRNAALQ